jgi:hypothetical protein
MAEAVQRYHNQREIVTMARFLARKEVWALRTPCIVKSRISGKDADTVARHALKRHPIRLAPEGVQEPPVALVPSDGLEQERKAPPRVRKPSPLNDQCLAPTPDLEGAGPTA